MGSALIAAITAVGPAEAMTNPKPLDDTASSYLNSCPVPQDASRIMPFDKYTAYSEPAIIQRGQTIIVAVNMLDYAEKTFFVTAFTSTDGGKTFPYKKSMRQIGLAGQAPVDLSTPTNGDLLNWQSSDPSLTVGIDGRFYLSSVMFDFNASDLCSAENYFILASSADGLTWDGLKTVGGWEGTFKDRPWIVADDLNASVLWATYNEFKGPNCETAGVPGVPHVARSIDRGLTWTFLPSPVAETDHPNLNFVVMNGSAIIPIMTGDGIHVTVCTTQGCLDTAHVPATQVPSDQFRFVDMGVLQRINSFPAIVWNKKDPGAMLLMAWMDYVSNSQTRMMSSVSLNGGLTWTAPVAVLGNVNITEQFFPMVAWRQNPTMCLEVQPTPNTGPLYKIICAEGHLNSAGTDVVWPSYDKWTRIGGPIDLTTTGGSGSFQGDYLGLSGKWLATINYVPNVETQVSISRQAYIAVNAFGCTVVPGARGGWWLLVVPALLVARRRARRAGC